MVHINISLVTEMEKYIWHNYEYFYDLNNDIYELTQMLIYMKVLKCCIFNRCSLFKTALNESEFNFFS